MFFYLSKLIDFLLEPIFWVMILLLIGIFRNSMRRKCLIWATVIVLIFSNEFIYQEAVHLYEYPAVKTEELKKHYAAAIILGGLSHYNHEAEQIEFEGSADRLFNILPLYFEGRVKKILISGGSGRLNNDEREAPILRDYLLKIGVKNSDILVERESRNTYENARNSAELIREISLEGPFLLSTSASHMRRSVACFEKQELKVDAYPVDYLSRPREFNPDRLLRPKAHVLKSWNALLHEWVGYIFYKLVGYC